jgi:anti-sigma factor RsiW
MPHQELTTDGLNLMEGEGRRELLNAYLDGELSAPDALVVSEWLDRNPGALREVEHLRHIWDLLESYDDEPVPETFASGVMDAVGVERPALSGKGVSSEGGRVLSMAWYRRPLATAAAVLIAIGATAFVMSGRGEQSPPEGLSVQSGVAEQSSVAELRALGLEDLETLEYLHVIADADDETFEDLVAGSGLGG